MSLVPQKAQDSLCRQKHTDPAPKIPSVIRKIPCRWQAPNPGPWLSLRHRWPPEIRGPHHGPEQERMWEHTVSISPVSIDKVQRHQSHGPQTGKRIPLLHPLESSRPPSKEHWEWGGRSTLFSAGSSSARVRLAAQSVAFSLQEINGSRNLP